MRRYSRWIALVALVAVAAPFLAQGLSILLSVEPVYVAAVLLVLTAAAIAIMARRGGEEEK